MASRAGSGIIYPEQALPTGRMVGLGLQHVIAMFGATVLAPVLMGFDTNLAIFFSGIGTLIFMLIVRGRIPSYLGSSFAFIAPVVAAKEYGGVPAALGGIAAAAIVYAVVAVLIKTKAGTRALEALMPPAVTAAVIAVIGIGLAPVAWDMAGNDWSLALVTLAVAIAVAVAAKGTVKLIPVLVAVVIGYIIAALLGKVDFTAVMNAPWLGLPNFVMPTINLSAISLIVPVVVMLLAENIGHVKAISAYMERDLTPHIGDAFLGDATATFVSALGGGTGQTTYAENIGVMSITKVFSIRPLQVAAVTAICLGLVPKFGALVGTIPVPVMGGISFMLFGLIAGTSSKVIASAKEDWGTLENFGVFGISIALCTAMVAKQVTLQLGGVVLDPIGASTFAAVLLNLGIVLLKKISPFVAEEEAEPEALPIEPAEAV
ncbi:MAG: NCS2 family nucleobase:cation symporter [Dehalococcoidales bacterium]|nr:NCS2 family nucleobase:cation symporter [Dehalococcoidales bacterium]